MHRQPIPLKTVLLNSADIEVWPAGLLKARSNADARHLSRALAVLRRKRDGRYLAVVQAEGLQPLVNRLAYEPGLAQAVSACDDWLDRRAGDLAALPPLPLDGLRERLRALDLDESYGQRSGLPLVAEPATLAFAGFDRYRRPLWLSASAARAWLALRAAAAANGVSLEAISGYRSHAYQLGIFERKLARGQTIAQILTVNAAPGYSEHHGGMALDISTPGEPAAEESFEHSAAFAWLQQHAAAHDFHMSYPRDNPHGIVYEPWHWRHGPAADASVDD
ncbi:M15 family metallopeptidase [Pseudoxanthomonas dokdonensis]|uniref:Peptidase n=1 Tax=Pseudoxanthomonas dokdonensis TaxID=344882 RepID=A0A0R0CU16_9GAMM|nr:M15 family metallopeptidase [Pseudoxanthomonas dokdonensis]KRG69818.1 peptidase [Pseudoxanthomonas dokdonensis]